MKKMVRFLCAESAQKPHHFLQVFNGSERTPFEQFANQDTEPATAFGSVVFHYVMTGITEEGGATDHRDEDSALPFLLHSYEQVLLNF